MEEKRIREDPDNISDKPHSKKFRRLPSFTMVIRQAEAANYRQKFVLALEPFLRRVVQEEVERVFVSHTCLLPRIPQMLIEEAKPGLQLIFKKSPSLSMFTENNIKTEDGFPLEILFIDTATRNKSTTSPSTIKVELVVLDGDFPYDNSEGWSSTDFNRYIVKERKGRKPLLTGDTIVTLKDGSASIDELKFTDNSSWIRCGKFRIGARVLCKNQQGLNIQEAVTSRIIVRDHRGETYRKHYPPSLGDEVWRLQKISKDGVFHKRLTAENIKTVQDFLKLSVIDSARLQKKILEMSNRKYEAAINHAWTCPLGDKLYIHHGPPFAITLTPICQVWDIKVDGVSWTFQDLTVPAKATVQKLVLEAYNCWDRLQEISLPLQGETVNQVVNEPHDQIEYNFDGGLQNDEQMGLYNWSQEM